MMVKGLLLVGIHVTALLAAPTANVESAGAADGWRDWVKSVEAQTGYRASEKSASSWFGGEKAMPSWWGGYRGKHSSAGKPQMSWKPKPDAAAQHAKDEGENGEEDGEEEGEEEETAVPPKAESEAAPSKPEAVALPKPSASAVSFSNSTTSSADAKAMPQTPESDAGETSELEPLEEASPEPAAAKASDATLAPAPKVALSSAQPESAKATAIPAAIEAPRAPTAPEAPAAEDEPADTSAPSDEGAVEAPSIPAAPAVPEVPEVPEVPAAPAAHKVPSRPNKPWWQGPSSGSSWFKPSSGSYWKPSSSSSSWKPSAGASPYGSWGNKGGAGSSHPRPATPKPKHDDPKPEPAAPVAAPMPEEVPSEISPSTPAKPAPVDSASSAPLSSVRTGLWQPKAGQKWQIILDAVPDTKATPFKPDDAQIWDIDLWDAKKADVDGLHARGKKVICYFSAGTSESWRDDYAQLKEHNLGQICKDDACSTSWGGEEWVDPRNKAVWAVMKKRIQMASDKGCDAIDPDNMDFYDNTIKSKAGAVTKLTEADSVRYLKFMADEASRFNMSTGLKNAISILPAVHTFIQFAVNEECVKNDECAGYSSFLAKDKPVFHIEYTSASTVRSRLVYTDTQASTKKFCNFKGSGKFSTIMKPGDTLSASFLYCDGKLPDETIVKSGGGSKGKGKVRVSAGGGEDASGGDDDDSGNASRMLRKSVPMLYRRQLA